MTIHGLRHGWGHGLSAAALASALALAACTETMGNKQTIGTLLGAAGGAVLGNEVGGGSGRVLATVAGGLAGAFIGNQIGLSLDRADQLHAERASQQALDAPVGQTIAWNNPQSGNSGSYTPVRDGTDVAGNYCREYQTTVTVGGQAQEAYGTACRQPDGAWMVVN